MPAELSKVAAENKCLPADVDNAIRSPRYVPKGSGYLTQWGKWLRETPVSQWPPWLVTDVQLMKAKRAR